MEVAFGVYAAQGETYMPEGITLFPFWVLMGRAPQSDCKEVISS